MDAQSLAMQAATDCAIGAGCKASIEVLHSSKCNADFDECAKNTDFIAAVYVDGKEIARIPASALSEEQLKGIWKGIKGTNASR